MLGATSSLHTATDGSVAHRMRPGPWVAPWRALAAAALLLLALGSALSRVLAAEHPSAASPARHRPAPPRHDLSSLPLGAQAPISAALGADDPAYRLRSSRGGFRATSPALGLKESFGPWGVQVDSGQTRVGLSLRAIGYGSSLAAVRAAPPRASANRVSYTHPGLSEWYVNGPLGLEQGFTITRAPSRPLSTPLTLSLALAGDARATLGVRGQSLTLGHAGGPALRYGGLRVSDVRGHTLHSWLQLRPGGVLLRVNARGARYPLRIDPFIQQGEKLTGAGQSGTIAPGLGFSMALSSDGNTALIGGPSDYGKTGAAWVFTRSGSTWTQQGSKLTGTEEIGEGRFGGSVALSSDGNTALIGAPSDSTSTGAAWAFTRSEGKWSHQGSKLTGSGEAGLSEFGSSVALSSTGSAALMGGPGDVRDVEREGEVTEKSTLVKGLSSTAGIEVGTEVSGAKIEGGTTVVTVKSSTEVTLSKAVEGTGSGTVKEKLNFITGVGAVWAFTRSGETWTQQGSKLTASGEIGNGVLGASVALSADGKTALLGAPGDNKGAGAAFVFTSSSETWTQQAKLAEPLNAKSEKEEISSELLPGELGASVALASASSGAANTALLGAPGDNKGLGAAWVYTGSGSTWTKQGSKLTGSGEMSEEPGENKFPGAFGASVALSSAESGTAAATALIGGPGDSKGVGAAWAFTRSAGTWSAQGPKLTGSGEVSSELAPGEFGSGVALSSDGSTGLIGGPGDSSGVGAAWAFTRTGETWTQQGSKLTGTGAAARTAGGFGMSAALSSDGNTALIGGPEDGKGAAWVFTRSGGTWTQQGAKLTGGEEAGTLRTQFGAGVALSSDGNTALIGGPHDENEVGAAWVFTRSGETWTQQGPKLKGAGENGLGTFGSSVALSSDGNTALIGGREDNNFAGAAWVFTRSEGKWTQQGSKLTGAGGEFAEFGFSVALSSDGNTALVGGSVDHQGMGAVWPFHRAAGVWTPQGSKLTGTGETGVGRFGFSVALSSDGNTALIGGPIDNSEVGAAWVFTRSGETWTQQGEKLTGPGESGKGKFGTAVALSSKGNTALIGGLGDNKGLGAAWVFTRSGETWTQYGSKLTGTGATGESKLGSGAALSSTGNTALLGASGDYNKTGAAWVFVQALYLAPQKVRLSQGSGTGKVKVEWADEGVDLEGHGPEAVGVTVYRKNAASPDTAVHTQVYIGESKGQQSHEYSVTANNTYDVSVTDVYHTPGETEFQNSTSAYTLIE
jgi:FG-GAP repeat